MKRTLFATPAIRVELGRFAPNAHQAPHRDQQSRITLVLQGAFSEEGAAAADQLRAGDVLLKSREAVHEDRFSAQGARVVSIVFEDDAFEMAGITPWLVRRESLSLRSALAALEGACAKDAGAVITAASDLLGQEDEGNPRRAAPIWLNRIKESLETASLADVNVTAEARAAGVHPAHASRLFRRCFGTSITDFAQAQSVRRALPALAGAAPLGQIALEAGFYDQSHMNRVFRRVTGRTPGAHRALVAGQHRPRPLRRVVRNVMA